MFSSFQSTPASAAALTRVHIGPVGSSNVLDDVALGCECADPALQIDLWSKEALQAMQPVAARA